MSYRAAKVGLAVAASFIASASFIPMSHGETPAADECLSAPKGETPEGGHWHYRVEHPSSRHCWYVRGADGSAVKPAASAAPAKPALTNVANSAEIPGSVANARAELTSRRTGLNQNSSALTGQTPAAALNVNAGALAVAAPQAAPSQTTPFQASTASDGNTTGSVVASRWLDQFAANVPAASPPVDSTQVVSPPPPVSTQDASPSAADGAPADTTPGPISTQFGFIDTVLISINTMRATIADALAQASQNNPRATNQVVIMVMAVAFLIAGLFASAVRLGGRRKNRVRVTQATRRANWDAARQPPSRFASLSATRLNSPSLAPQRRNIGLPLELRDAEQEEMEEEWHEPVPTRQTETHDARVVDMLSRLARSAQA